MSLQYDLFLVKIITLYTDVSILGMEWNALIIDGESALYGVIANKKIENKDKEEDWKHSARVHINFLDLHEAVTTLCLLLHGWWL